MESNLNKSPIAPQTGDETLISAGQSSEQRISELSTALVVVTENFRSYRIKLRRQILIWIIVCIIIIIISGFFASLLLNESFPDKWTWQIGYISIIRITIAGAIFSIANFCFRIYRSYVQLNEHNTHCITVIQSMANLVGAAKDETQRNVIYGKLIDIITDFGDVRFNHNNDDFSSSTTVAVDAVKKVVEKMKN